MKKAQIIAVFLLLVFSLACSRKKEETTAVGEVKVPGKTERAPEEAPLIEPALVIAGVNFYPDKPYGHKPIQARPRLETEVEEFTVYTFRWFVNSEEVEGLPGPDLPAAAFKKHDWVHCMVKARVGEAESAWYKSNLIRILNSPPLIEELPPPDFNLPGTFRYQVKAHDEDGDELTYVLLSPLDLGIVLDPESGLLTWSITPELLPKLEDQTISIRFEVRDEDGDSHKTELLLDFYARESPEES